MSTFIQLHLLTSYPPSNLNRDDLGRPKTAIMGSEQRLRISSQCLKRAWRISDVFENALKGYIGTRTKEMGKRIYEQLIAGKIEEKKAIEWAGKIVETFGAKKSENKKKPLQELEIEQLAHFSPEEIIEIEKLVKKLIREKREPKDEEIEELLRKNHKAVDIAMFGRMLADKPGFNVEAAVQVAHAITVHRTAVEDDYFTAVDDLNAGEEHSGSAHLGEMEFGAGIYYLYVCINEDLLKENLQGNAELAKKAIKALTEATVTISPNGKQNSYASRAFASYVLAEKGEYQPRSLSAAFLKPVSGAEMERDAVAALKEMKNNFDKVYEHTITSYEMYASQGKGKLSELLNFVSQ
ncbi:MAG: type I-E CRISPR-associated protein Cas7/Cse4/CasC [Elusimicrobiota bacterium]